jgi:hypothetical protein
MVVPGVDPLAGQDDDPIGPGHDVVRRLGEVASLDHDVTGTPLPDALRHGDPSIEGPEGLHLGVAEHRRLTQVRRDHQRMGEEQRRVRRHAIGFEQPVPRGRDQDRIHHQLGEQATGGEAGHFGHDGGRGQHSGLDGAHGEVVQDRLDLLPHESRLEGDDAADLCRVLGGHRRQGARAVDVESGEGLQVGLDPRTPTRVGAGDGQRRLRCRVRHRATIGGCRGIVVR